MPRLIVPLIQAGTANLDNPEVTLALLKADAVVGVKGFFDASGKRLTGIGITCALCHSTVDDSLKNGIGRRLDGWPNRDLDIGAIIAAAPDLSAFAQLLQVDQATVRKVLTSWERASTTPSSISTARRLARTASRRRRCCRRPSASWA